jgi:hypothetical protein
MMRFTESKWWRMAILVVMPLFLIVGLPLGLGLAALLDWLGAPEPVPGWSLTAISVTWAFAFVVWVFVVPFFGLRALASSAVFSLVLVSSCTAAGGILERVGPDDARESSGIAFLVSVGIFVVLFVLHRIACHVVERRDWKADVEQRRAALGIDEAE